jgi:signal transduction histidine kinase
MQTLRQLVRPGVRSSQLAFAGLISKSNHRKPRDARSHRRFAHAPPDNQDQSNHWITGCYTRGYLVAIIAPFISLLLRVAARPLFEDSGPFLFFTPAVMLSAWYGGCGPGLVATVLGAALGDYFLLGPVGSFFETATVVAKVILFLLVGGQISWLSGALFNAKVRAQSDAASARESEQLYRTLAQNFPHGAVFLVDARMRLVLAEGHALSVSRIVSAEIMGRHLGQAFPRSLRASIGKVLRSASPGQPATGEISFGGRIYLLHLLPLNSITAQRFGGMGIAQDITELVSAREELRAAHARLEARVHERTAELEFQKTLLETQSNASLDGILVASRAGQVIFHNRRLLDLWNLPAGVFASSFDSAVRAMRAKLADDQNPFDENAREEMGLPGELPPSVTLQDGKTFETYSAELRNADGGSYGRVWYFRDVTERRRLAKQILEAGERERQRIGLDLHDDLCPHLAGVGCLGRVLQRHLEVHCPMEAPAAGRIVELIEQAVRRARDLARGLQPLQMKPDGLPTALEQLAANVESMFQVRCTCRLANEVVLHDTATGIHLYHIAQEAMNNAVRHGKASQISMELAHLGNRVILTIKDDGVGISSDPVPGLGLQAMRHRARLVGGGLTVEPNNAGKGTLVTCWFPSSRTGVSNGTIPSEIP